jgi:signal transduction histidine kinase
LVARVAQFGRRSADVTHQVRNSIASISGLAQTLLNNAEALEGGRSRALLELIADQAGELGALVAAIEGRLPSQIPRGVDRRHTA